MLEKGNHSVRGCNFQPIKMLSLSAGNEHNDSGALISRYCTLVQNTFKIHACEEKMHIKPTLHNLIAMFKIINTIVYGF